MTYEGGYEYKRSQREHSSLQRAVEREVAVITGGSSGIGFATAQQFVREGAYVFLTGRRQAELEFPLMAPTLPRRRLQERVDMALLPFDSDDHFDKLFM